MGELMFFVILLALVIAVVFLVSNLRQSKSGE